MATQQFREHLRVEAAKKGGPDQSASNTVLFEMMQFYKRAAEGHAEEANELRKRMRIEADLHADEMAIQQQRFHHQVMINHHFAQVNLRATETAHRKHQAGLRMAHCLDDLFTAIELVEETRLGNDGALGIEYISMHKTRIQQRADTALQMFLHEPEMSEVERFENEIVDGIVAAREVIDLTIGEETEEEVLSGEETETDVEM